MVNDPIIPIPGILTGHRSNATVRERPGSARKRGVTRPLIWKQGITAGSVEIPRRQCFVNTTSEFAGYEQFLRRKLHKIEGARHCPPVSRLNVSSTH
jgi:hypothetical protein